MEASICIVSRNRKSELEKNLRILYSCVQDIACEILVFLDGCTDSSKDLISLFPNCYWEVSEKSIGPSRARNRLFQKAQGILIFGFDDDAHPLQPDFVSKAKRMFAAYDRLGIITFEEIKGVFDSDTQALQHHQELTDFYCSEFVGCGFVIRKDVYSKTAGFPVWMDIYGEESSLSLQVIDAGYDILYTSAISVNHRVNKTQRGRSGYNLMRFQKQLTNTSLLYSVHYPLSMVPKRVLRLYIHNFRKYSLKNVYFFSAFIKAGVQFLILLPKVVFQNRKPVKKGAIQKMKTLGLPIYG
ncbi:glycosyltransferase family 2 protein [Leeuwenhoekiella parthenopeia]|uniref:Glycosyltransferase n=1 Tax=Leeuwenhoekiella parthenopeia TaxID=2890320 RepID=A0ABS8GZX1_9FLAO|nr:glycosyltransferase [Leeuwenhoekiella parthenopeia]MCC4214651.1 glycosyltransferase [Leeuwenhoekiella parthenopeia]